MIKRLLDLGAKAVTEPSFFASRPKVMGCMWDGQYHLNYNGIDLNFELWYHGNDEETLETLLEHFSLDGIRVEGEYYDCSWYTIITPTEIWLHKEGWFYNRSLREHTLIKRRGNPNFHRPTYTREEEIELEKLGFQKLLSY